MGRSISEAQGQEKKILKIAEVERLGEKIIIPDKMSIRDALTILKAKEVEEEEVVNLSESFDYYVWEGVAATVAVLEERFGWMQQVGTPGFFGKTPPSMISVDVDVDKTVQMPWGRFLVPGIPEDDGFFSTSYEMKDNNFVAFRLSGQLKKKHSIQFHEICKSIREYLKVNSLYKGKAIEIEFHDSDGDAVEMPHPKFSRIDALQPKDVIFSRSLENNIGANLWTPISNTVRVRRAGIPLKRGILLAGPYGTGKTLVATVTANLCKQNGWTYLFCRRAIDFAKTVDFARRYQPAVVFCEDIDKATKGERSVEMDEILNTIDGVDSKSSDIILVLTTNEVEKIHPAMLRPGRLDAVVTMTLPDSEAVGRLIKFYAKELLINTGSLSRIGKKLAGQTPAVIREVVERSKLSFIQLNPTTDIVGIDEDALLVAADTMADQLHLLEAGANQTKLSTLESFSTILGKHIGTAIQVSANYADKQGLDLEAIINEEDKVVTKKALRK